MVWKLLDGSIPSISSLDLFIGELAEWLIMCSNSVSQIKIVGFSKLGNMTKVK